MPSTPYYTLAPADRDRLGRFLSGRRGLVTPILVGCEETAPYNPAILVPKWCRERDGEHLYLEEMGRLWIYAVGMRRSTHEERLWCSLDRETALQVIARHRELRGNDYPTITNA
jgi:hypothetical protein